ncbi:hypothetical protein [Duganella lactea]|nr:hypothetical protein [Duganella lactea]
MHKGKKTSSAASNVVQAKAKMERDGRIEFLSQARSEHGVAPLTGELTLTIIFPPREGHKQHRLDVSFLLGFPNLQPMFTDAFLYWGANLSPKTRICRRDSLRRFFFAYLESAWSNLLYPDEIDDELLTGFKDSLLKEIGTHGKPLHPMTVSKALSDLRSMLAAVNIGQWARDANSIAARIPLGPAGAEQKLEPTEVLRLEHLLAILEAAENEVLAIEQRFERAKVLLAEGQTRLVDPSRKLKNTRADYRDLATCLAALDKAYPGVIPLNREIRAMHPTLASAIHNTHGQDEINSYLYPSSRDLVPFALLIAIATVFNPETLLNLRWGDIDFDKDQAGIPAIEIVGEKGRASRNLVRLLDPNAAVSSQLSLKRTLACLREITLRIRPHLAQDSADKLFVYVPRSNSRQPTGFCGESHKEPRNNSDSCAWPKALKNFIKDNRLIPFTLNQLRPSILDLVQFMDGSLETARKVGNHCNPATTWTHYTSGGVKTRYRERIGQIILLRERWLRSNGVIDPRRLTPGQDKGAATPGFSCLDPFDSPRPNQKPGKLCGDYGGCPSCPLAAAHPGDPLSVAHYRALETAIYRSQANMSASTWVERWTPILADLTALRAWIPQTVLEASRDISINLPNVG